MPRKNKRSRAMVLRWKRHAALQQLLVVKEEVSPEQQECSSSVDQKKPEPPPHIKEEQEELWSSQEGEQLQGLEEADITKFPFTPVPVKSEDDEEKAQSSQLHQRQTQHMEAEADGEDCGGPEPARNSHPHPPLQPETEDQTGDSSEPETDDSADWKETREPKSALNSLKHDSRCKKTFSCSECGRIFGTRGHLFDHMRIHPGEKKYSCSVCNKRFIWRQQVRRHKCVILHSSQLQSQTEEKREAEPQASRETQHMETETDGEDCGGPEPARNSHPHPLLQPQTEDPSEPEADNSADWKETREPQSGLNSLKHDSRCKKTFSCSECGRRFGAKQHLKKHMRIHTGEKPFSCSECDKAFTDNGNLKRHMITHTGEKPFSCSVCKKSFTQSGHLQKHMRIHTGEKPFSCSVCKKSFSQRGSLWSHMVVHTGEKRFSCSVCNKRFVSRSDVKTHKCVSPMETEADGEVCGGPEPARNSHPLLQPETEVQTGDSSEPEIKVSCDDWDSREPQSALKSLKNNRWFRCSECGKRFGNTSSLSVHIRIHTGEKPFSGPVCATGFTQKIRLISPMKHHTREKPSTSGVGECSSSVDQQEPESPPHIKEEQEELRGSQEGEQLQRLEEADITKFPFTLVPVKSEDDEDEAQSSQLHQRQTHHMVTEADGEDCGGPEPARNSHPLLQPETEDQTGDSSDPETVNADWMETREPQSALNSLKHDSRCKKAFSCSECGKRFYFISHLKTHMMTHTEEKPFACSVCSRRFAHWLNLIKHMVIHTICQA
ncbi:uncharacterized protein LOC144528555 [Sander vitreus]